jgi:hypothetical protein
MKTTLRFKLITSIVAIATVAAIAWATVTSRTAPAVGLYWIIDGDPTTSPGVSAPQYQLGIRTDSPTLYYHATTSPTGWVSLSGGGGGGSGTVTSISCDAGTSCTPDPITSIGTITVNQQLNVPNGQVFLTTGGTLNNWDPWTIAGVGRTSYVEIDPNTASTTITGLAAGNDGDYVTLWNGGNGGSAGVDGGTGLPDTVTLVSQSASSLAANRFWIADGKMVNIPNNDGVVLRYDGGFGWVCFSCATSIVRAQELSLDPAAIPAAIPINTVVNDYSPFASASQTTSYVRQDISGGPGQITITGIVAAGAPNSEGRLVVFENVSSNGIILFTNDDSASSPANRILTSNGSGVTLSPQQSITLIYDNTADIWRAQGYTGGDMENLSVNGDITLNGSNPSFQNQQLVNDPNGIWFSNLLTGVTHDVKMIDSVPNGSINTTAGPLLAEGGAFDNRTTKSAGSNTLTNYGVYGNAINGDVNYSGYFDNGSFIVNGQATMNSITLQGNETQHYAINSTNVDTARTAPFTSISVVLAGTNNTTVGGQQNVAISGAASATRSAGSNPVNNIGLYGNATGGQNNYSCYCDSGGLTQIQGDSVFAAIAFMLGSPTAIQLGGAINANGNSITSILTATITGTTNDALAVSSNIDIVGAGHLVASGTQVTSITNGTCATAVCTDIAGAFTTSSVTATVTFQKSYSTRPTCTLYGEGTATPPICTVSATAITCTTVANSTVYDYECVGAVANH